MRGKFPFGIYDKHINTYMLKQNNNLFKIFFIIYVNYTIYRTLANYPTMLSGCPYMLTLKEIERVHYGKLNLLVSYAMNNQP